MDLLLFIVSIVLLTVMLPVAYASWIGAPLAVTPKNAVRRMIEAAELDDREVAYDPGAGTGRFILIARKEYQADVRGVELAPAIWLMGRVNLKLHGVEGGLLELGNFFKKDLREADVCFVFLMPKTLRTLRPKFERELKKGGRVVSYAFPVAGWKPKKVIKEAKMGAIYLYER